MEIDVEVRTPKMVVEKERQRLLNLPNTADFKSWLGNRKYPLNWMKLRFGETLVEKDGFTHASGQKFDDLDCSICGHEIKRDEKVINLNVDDGEYLTLIYLCKNCLKKFLSDLE